MLRVFRSKKESSVALHVDKISCFAKSLFSKQHFHLKVHTTRIYDGYNVDTDVKMTFKYKLSLFET